MAEPGVPPPPRVIVLDLGDTLLDVDRYEVEEGVRTFLEGSDIPGRPDAPDEIESWLSDLESVIQATRLLDDREFSLSDWLRSHLPISMADAAVAELAIWIAGIALRPVEGAREALAELHDRGVRLAVLSNTSFSGRTLEFELRRQGFGTPFDTVLSSADCGRRKPSPESFRTALARLDVPPAEAWYVGDSWECDVVGATGVGMTALWFDRAAGVAGDATPHHPVRAWKDVVGLVDAARRGSEC
jgi:putative hydrolase of the HAD superfamily